MEMKKQMVMVSDERTRPLADEALAGGDPWQDAVWLCGSFARVAWVRDHVEAGDIPRTELFPEWLDLWVSGDPDDTDPWALGFWEEASEWAGGLLTDAPDGLPAGSLTVYRGQSAGDPLGISWTLDPAVAHMFAAGIRVALPDGVVYTGTVEPADVLGYITQRDEAEIVVDPSKVWALPDEW
jgi:hypothetical protein